jgi:hypothetical protein
MHIRREIDNLLDKMIEITANKKESNKESRELNEIKDEISRKTDNGKRAKGMWTDSPEFVSIQ